jgi:glycopeptide antibiotics resistance protein
MSKKRKTTARILFFLYLIVLFRITAFRAGFWQNGLFSGSFLLEPMGVVRELLQTGNWFRFGYLFFGNIVWFLPLGAALAARRVPFWKGVLAGFGVSFLIEFLQFFFGSGVSDVDDLILNTAGCAAGYPTYFLLQRPFLIKIKKRTRKERYRETGRLRHHGKGSCGNGGVLPRLCRFEIEWDGKDPSVYLKKTARSFMFYGRGDMEKLVRHPLRYAKEGSAATLKRRSAWKTSPRWTRPMQGGGERRNVRPAAGDRVMGPANLVYRRSGGQSRRDRLV